MNLNEVLAQAKRNQTETSTVKRSSYSTKVAPPKKLPKGQVDQSAIKAFLKKQQDEEKKKGIEAMKKKEELLKLRTASKTTRKANSMARRTKDNLKVYKGEDILGLYPEPKKRRSNGNMPELTPEEERKHKAFMRSIGKLKVPGINDIDNGVSNEPLPQRDERKLRKLEKQRAKARMAANLEFSDLLELAEKKKHAQSDSSSSEESDSGDDSDDSNTDRYGKPLTAEEKYHRERRKRRELEERLKSAEKSQKSSPKSLGDFKIAKLSAGMSDEAKRAKVKALMEKFKKSDGSQAPTNSNGDSKRKNSDNYSTRKYPDEDSKRKNYEHDSKRNNYDNDSKRKNYDDDSKRKKYNHDSKRRNSDHDPKRKHSDHDSKRKNYDNNSKRKYSDLRVSSDNVPKSNPHSLSHKKEERKQESDTCAPAKKPKMLPPASSVDQSISSYLKKQELMMSSKKDKVTAKKPQISESRPPKSEPVIAKKPSFVPVEKKKVISNPYKHTVVKPKRPDLSKSMIDPWSKEREAKKKLEQPPVRKGKCTLSVTSEEVRTNYPGVAREDPYIKAYKKHGRVIENFTPESIERYKAHMVRKLRDQGKPIPPQLRNSVAAPPKRQRYGVIDDDSDEYDSELEGFIADDDEVEEEIDVSSHIKQIFGYDKAKYGRESEWELSKMDASYKDIEKEEKRSLRIAKEEDAREAKLEEERMKKKRK